MREDLISALSGIVQCLRMEAAQSDCEIFADVNPRKRAISISSVDSEPIQKFPRGEDSDDSQDEDDVKGGNHLSDPLQAETLCEEEDSVDPFIPLERVSEGSVASVTAVLTNHTFVAECDDDALVMDAGTRMCLSDGTYVGTISSVLGPVKKALYVISCHQKLLFAALTVERKVAESTKLHYDLSKQCILFNPFVQCDTNAGTDASYVNDEELPKNVRPDFSDDEKEEQWKRDNKRKGTTESISSCDDANEVCWDSVHCDLDVDDSSLVPPKRVLAPSWMTL